MPSLTGVSGHFSASHHPRDGGIVHGHTYHVLAWFKVEPNTDAICYRAALRNMLEHWDHTLLPPELAWGEDIARAVGTLVNCVEVIVSRDAEGLHARWLAA